MGVSSEPLYRYIQFIILKQDNVFPMMTLALAHAQSMCIYIYLDVDRAPTMSYF